LSAAERIAQYTFVGSIKVITIFFIIVLNRVQLVEFMLIQIGAPIIANHYHDSQNETGIQGRKASFAGANRRSIRAAVWL